MDPSSPSFGTLDVSASDPPPLQFLWIQWVVSSMNKIWRRSLRGWKFTQSHLQGSCGYGLLSQTVYPFWSVGALSTSNSFSLAGPSTGCGQCFEVQCVNSGGQFAVRLCCAPIFTCQKSVQFTLGACLPPTHLLGTLTQRLDVPPRSCNTEQLPDRCRDDAQAPNLSRSQSLIPALSAKPTTWTSRHSPSTR